MKLGAYTPWEIKEFCKKAGVAVLVLLLVVGVLSFPRSMLFITRFCSCTTGVIVECEYGGYALLDADDGGLYAIPTRVTGKMRRDSYVDFQVGDKVAVYSGNRELLIYPERFGEIYAIVLVTPAEETESEPPIEEEP